MLPGVAACLLVAAPADAVTKRRSSGPSFGTRELRPGMSGNDVKTLQRFLTMAGYRVRQDGQFGRATYNRVRTFEYQELLKVDGVVQRTDARKIYRAAADGPSGGVAFQSAPASSELPPVPGAKAKLLPDGTAVAPAAAPAAVKRVIAWGNKIAFKPYIYGGGHARFPEDAGYDCSGSVSYALFGGGLVKSSMPSYGYYNYGLPGPGKWITIYTNAGHMYMIVAGLRFDTSGARQDGSRWHRDLRDGAGFQVRHPVGY